MASPSLLPLGLGPSTPHTRPTGPWQAWPCRCLHTPPPAIRQAPPLPRPALGLLLPYPALACPAGVPVWLAGRRSKGSCVGVTHSCRPRHLGPLRRAAPRGWEPMPPALPGLSGQAGVGADLPAAAKPPLRWVMTS